MGKSKLARQQYEASLSPGPEARPFKLVDTAVVPSTLANEWGVGLSHRLVLGQMFKIKGIVASRVFRVMWVGDSYAVPPSTEKNAFQTWVVLIGDLTPINGRLHLQDNLELEIVEPS